MANNKKWYTYFVTVEDGTSQAPSASNTGDAVQAISDIAASLQPPAAQTQRVEQKLQAAAEHSDKSGAAGAKPMSFEEIYAAAEIPTPTHGYTILKVADMLESPHIKELPVEVKRSSVLVALDAAGVKVQEVVEDAIRRDKALDTFERVQQKQVEDFEASKLEENRKLQTELDKLAAAYKSKIQNNNASVTQRKEAFYGWKVEKQRMEQKIADAVSPFVSDNPITTTAHALSPVSSGKTGI